MKNNTKECKHENWHVVNGEEGTSQAICDNCHKPCDPTINESELTDMAKLQQELCDHMYGLDSKDSICIYCRRDRTNCKHLSVKHIKPTKSAKAKFPDLEEAWYCYDCDKTSKNKQFTDIIEPKVTNPLYISMYDSSVLANHSELEEIRQAICDLIKINYQGPVRVFKCDEEYERLQSFLDKYTLPE